MNDVKMLDSRTLTQRIAILRDQASRGILSYSEAKNQAQVYLDELNLRTVEIAKKYNKKPIKFQFAGFGARIEGR